MVIYCDSGGNVKSVPSMVTFGESLTDITIVTPQQSAAVLLKIVPPTGEFLPDMICAPIITDDGIVIYNVKLHKGVTVAAGRCRYQLEFVGSGEFVDFDEEGNEFINKGVVKWQSEEGSFNIMQGTNIDLPSSEAALKDYALEQYYALFESLSKAGLRITAAENLIGTGKELQTAEKNIIDAINAIHNRPTVTTDKTLTKEESAADAKAVGDELNKKVAFTDVIDNLATKDSQKPLSARQGAELDRRLRAIEEIPFAEEMSV